MPKTYKVNNEIYDISDNDSEAFLKDFPNAVEVQSFVMDKDTFDIPVNEVELFLKDMPNAKPLNQPKGAASEGQPATSGNASSGPIKPYRGSYKREETKPVSPVTIAPKQPKERVGGLIIGEESEIPQKVQKELKRQVAAEEVLQEGAPSVEGYYGELTADQKRAAQNYDPLKQAQDAVEYDNLKVATKDWTTSKGIGEVSKAISEGRTKEAFATAQDDYLESISDPNKRNSERAKIEELRTKPVEQLTQTDKDYLREINDKAINAYAAMEKVKIRELMGDADVQAYTDIASNLNTQFASVNKRLNDLKNSNLSQEEKRVRSMELEATAQRLQEKYNALTQETGVTQEQLALLNESYRNLQYINNADEANKLAFGAAERAVIDKEIKQRRKDEGPVADFMNSLTNTVVSGLLSTAQVPKVLGDMVGDEDYDAFDKVYDSLAASKATLSKEMGRKEGFEKLPLYAQIPTMLGEGIGSVALLAGGGAAIGGGSLGVTAAAFLTMEADMYEEMKNLGLSPQEAGKYATITSTLLGAVETIVPDAEYFDAKLASRSIIAAMRKGATNKEAINLALKEVLPSAMEYISRTGLSGVKEAGEESVGAISEGLLKNSINAIEGREVFKGSLNLDNVAEQALMGFVTGGALAAAGRMVASRRSEVQESALNALADNPTVFETALENDPTLESERSVVDEAAKIRAAWKAIPSFNNLNENVQNHIVSEALRVKQLTKAAKEAGADESAVAKEISDANANILYAQGKNRIRGEKTTPSPTMEWEGEDVKPKAQEEVVTPQAEQATQEVETPVAEEVAIEAEQPQAELTPEQQVQEAAIDEVKAIDPTLTEDEADQAAALVQSGETAETAIAEARQMAETENTLKNVVNKPFGELPENEKDFTGLGAGYLKNNMWASKKLGRGSKTSLFGNIEKQVQKGKKVFLYFVNPKLSSGKVANESEYESRLNKELSKEGTRTLTQSENNKIENKVGEEFANENVKAQQVGDPEEGTYRIFDTKNTELVGYVEATPELVERLKDPNLTEEQAREMLFKEAGVALSDDVLIHANENEISKYAPSSSAKEEQAQQAAEEVTEVEKKPESPQNKLIHFKSLYNKLGKKERRARGANLYKKIEELANELGYRIVTNPKSGEIGFLNSKGKRVAKVGVDRSPKEQLTDLKKAIAWTNREGTPKAKALLFFVRGGFVSSNEIERHFLSKTEELNNLIKKGLVVKSSKSRQSEIIQDIEDTPEISRGEVEEVADFIVDVLLFYGDRKAMAEALVDLYNDTSSVMEGDEGLTEQEYQEREAYYENLRQNQEYIDAMQSIDELAAEWDALPKEEQDEIINLTQYESEIDQRTESVFNEAVSEREDGGTDVAARSEKRTAKAKEDLTSFEKQRLSEISNRKQEIEGEISSIKKQKASKEREISKRIQDNSENLFGEKNNKREQELFEDEIDSSNQNLKSILGEYDSKIKSLQDEYSSLSSEENNILYSEKEKDLFAQAEEVVTPEVATSEVEAQQFDADVESTAKALESNPKAIDEILSGYDTKTIYYRGTESVESYPRESVGQEHFTKGVSTSKSEKYAKTHGDNVNKFYGKKGKFIDYFELFSQYQNEIGTDEFTEEELTNYGISKGYVGTVLDDPLAGVDYRFFQASSMVNADNAAKSIAESYRKAKADGSNPELVAAVEKSLGKPTTTQQAIESDIFAAVDAEPTTPTEKAAARRASKAKFGKEAYEKAVKITKNFNKIIESLEREGEVTKKCP